jgi:hypothetical protein
LMFVGEGHKCSFYVYLEKGTTREELLHNCPVHVSCKERWSCEKQYHEVIDA